MIQYNIRALKLCFILNTDDNQNASNSLSYMEEEVHLRTVDLFEV